MLLYLAVIWVKSMWNQNSVVYLKSTFFKGYIWCKKINVKWSQALLWQQVRVFFTCSVSKTKQTSVNKHTFRTLFNTLKQNPMRNLEHFRQSSLLSKTPKIRTGLKQMFCFGTYFHSHIHLFQSLSLLWWCCVTYRTFFGRKYCDCIRGDWFFWKIIHFLTRENYFCISVSERTKFHFQIPLIKKSNFASTSKCHHFCMHCVPSLGQDGN